MTLLISMIKMWGGRRRRAAGAPRREGRRGRQPNIRKHMIGRTSMYNSRNKYHYRLNISNSSVFCRCLGRAARGRGLDTPGREDCYW